MSIYIGNDLEDRLNALEVENALLKKYNKYHQVVHEIDHTSDLHLDSSFYKQSVKLDNYVKIEEWFDSSLGQSMIRFKKTHIIQTNAKLKKIRQFRKWISFHL